MKSNNFRSRIDKQRKKKILEIQVYKIIDVCITERYFEYLRGTLYTVAFLKNTFTIGYIFVRSL